MFLSLYKKQIKNRPIPHFYSDRLLGKRSQTVRKSYQNKSFEGFKTFRNQSNYEIVIFAG
jgi:hypothetical protein